MRSPSAMSDDSGSHATSLGLLLQEIDATPKEYWTELLTTLRQFRQKLPSATPIVIDAEQARKNQAAIDLLDSWMADDTEDAAEHQRAWDYLKIALDEDRLSDRPLFHEPIGTVRFWATRNANKPKSQRRSSELSTVVESSSTTR